MYHNTIPIVLSSFQTLTFQEDFECIWLVYFERFERANTNNTVRRIGGQRYIRYLLLRNCHLL